MTAALPYPFHVALAVAPHEAQATASGVMRAFSLIQQVAPGACELKLSQHDEPAALPDLPRLECVLLSAAGEPLDGNADDVRHIWGERVKALRARAATVLMLNQFRCVSRQLPDHPRRLFRIRELNRAQIALAQEHDLIIVNLDSVLADLGGMFLTCDYRLTSKAGQLAADYAVAHAMLKSGLRDRVDAQSLDAALRKLGSVDDLRLALSQIQRPNGKTANG